MNDTERRKNGKVYDNLKTDNGDMMAQFQALKAFNEGFMGDIRLLKPVMGGIGPHTMIMTPFRCFSLDKVEIGEACFINTNCFIMADGGVKIGNHVGIAPNVCIYTAGHPLTADQRKSSGAMMISKKVVIEDDCWICGSVVINQGVTIGKGTVIGSGSVVTHDIPAGVLAAGNPCRVIRTLGPEDEAYWQEQIEEYLADPDTQVPPRRMPKEWE